MNEKHVCKHNSDKTIVTVKNKNTTNAVYTEQPMNKKREDGNRPSGVFAYTCGSILRTLACALCD